MRMKIVWSICIVGLSAIVYLLYLVWHLHTHQYDDLKKIGARNALQRQAETLIEQGQYEEALPILWEASKAKYINQEYEKAHPIGRIVDVLKFQGEYEEALKVFAWFLRHKEPAEAALEEKEEIETLIQYQKTGDPQVVKDYMAKMQKKYEVNLPPKGYSSIGSSSQIAEFLSLYDAIGDLDGGIAYIDMCMTFFKQQDIKKYGEYRPGHADEEFKKVREAFEQDKAEGKKGRATRALIQSDYFPW